MRFGSLFAGAGGFDCGLERAGMQCAWQVEIDPFCRKVLAKHWPDVRRWDDVRTFPPDDDHDYSVDLIAGGFPCQDISSNNSKGKGLDGERSGLWFEYERIIRALRPRYVVVENVPNLFIRGFERVLGSLASLRYDAEWFVLSARKFGAHHLRERLFIIAYLPNAIGDRWQGWGALRKSSRWGNGKFTGLVRDVLRTAVPAGNRGRVSDGASRRVDRLRALGNAVVPAIAQWIVERIMSMEDSHA